MSYKYYRGARPPDPEHPAAVPPLVVTVIMRGEGTADPTRQPLNPRSDLRNHSPSGFECGYSGSGPAQLALALLADALGHDAHACTLYQDFKEDLIATLPRDQDWLVTENLIRRWATGALKEESHRARLQRQRHLRSARTGAD